MEHKNLKDCITVGELIEKLQKFPQDMKVVRMTDGYYPVHDAFRPTLIVCPFVYVHNPGNGWAGITIEEDENVRVLWV